MILKVKGQRANVKGKVKGLGLDPRQMCWSNAKLCRARAELDLIWIWS